MAYVCPRGIGPTAWSGSEKAQTQRLRRFYLLGQTVDGMRVWDIHRAVQSLRGIGGLNETPLWIQAHRHMAADAVYASLFTEGIKRLDLHDLPTTHNGTVDGAVSPAPALLNVLKTLDLPQAVAMAADKTRVVIYTKDKASWEWPATLLKNLGKEKQLQLREPMVPGEAK
jgi:hypothetical protein